MRSGDSATKGGEVEICRRVDLCCVWRTEGTETVEGLASRLDERYLLVLVLSIGVAATTDWYCESVRLIRLISVLMLRLSFRSGTGLQ